LLAGESNQSEAIIQENLAELAPAEAGPIAQDPAEAGYDGMPKSAIETGGVDLILPIGKMPQALAERAHGRPPSTQAAAADSISAFRSASVQFRSGIDDENRA